MVEVVSVVICTYISETSSGILFKISPSKLLSIASGVVSSSNLEWRYLIISSLLVLIGRLVTLPARRLVISGRMCGLPVTNILVAGDSWRILFSESRSLIRCPGTHSSRASMHMNVCFVEEVVCNIFTMFGSRGLRPPIEFFWSS